MNLALQNIWQHPKSTIMSALGLALAVLVAVEALPHGVKPLALAIAILRAVIGFLSKDGGR